MVKRVGATAAVAAAMAVVVAATLGGTASAKTAKTAPLCKKAGLGFAGPVSGPAAFLGDDQSNWVKLFISYWNAGKPIPGVPKTLKRVKLTLAKIGDSQLNPQAAATVARDMVADKAILGMVGFAGSNENLGGGPILDAAKLAYVSGSATKDSLTTGAKGQKPLKYFFRVVPNNSQQANAGVSYIVKKLKLKGQKVLVVDDAEAYGIDIANAAIKAFTKAGVKVVAHDSVPESTSGTTADFSTEANKAVASGVKLVYAPTQTASDSQHFEQQLHQAGYRGAFMATDGSVDPTNFKYPGAYISFFGPSIQKVNSAFVKAFEKRYGKQSATDPFGAPSFVAAEMLGVAISQQCAATHGTKISRALVAQRLKRVRLPSTILGYSMAFNNKRDAYHGPNAGVTVFQIQANGTYKEVYAAG